MVCPGKIQTNFHKKSLIGATATNIGASPKAIAQRIFEADVGCKTLLVSIVHVICYII